MLDPAVKSALGAARARIDAGDTAAATAIYGAAWDAALERGDHASASVIAHLAGISAEDPDEKLRWNLDALREADSDPTHPLMAEFYPSLYGNLAYSYTQLGSTEEALRFAQMAVGRLGDLRPGPYADRVREGIAAHLARLEQS